MSIAVCPKCQCQLEVKLAFASGPKSAKPSTTEAVDDVGSLLDAIEDGALNAYESDFISSTRARYAEYGSRIRMTDKQMNMLRKIATGDGGF